MNTKTISRNLENNIAEKRYRLAGISTQNEQEVRKVLLTEEATTAVQQFAGAEVVSSPDDILADNEIDLVVMPQSEKNNLEMVSLVLNSGKNLRIV